MVWFFSDFKEGKQAKAPQELWMSAVAGEALGCSLGIDLAPWSAKVSLGDGFQSVTTE
jgi:hypothetical protein